MKRQKLKKRKTKAHKVVCLPVTIKVKVEAEIYLYISSLLFIKFSQKIQSMLIINHILIDFTVYFDFKFFILFQHMSVSSFTLRNIARSSVSFIRLFHLIHLIVFSGNRFDYQQPQLMWFHCCRQLDGSFWFFRSYRNKYKFIFCFLAIITK